MAKVAWATFPPVLLAHVATFWAAKGLVVATLVCRAWDRVKAHARALTLDEWPRHSTRAVRETLLLRALRAIHVTDLREIRINSEVYGAADLLLSTLRVARAVDTVVVAGTLPGIMPRTCNPGFCDFSGAARLHRLEFLDACPDFSLRLHPPNLRHLRVSMMDAFSQFYAETLPVERLQTFRAAMREGELMAFPLLPLAQRLNDSCRFFLAVHAEILTEPCFEGERPLLAELLALRLLLQERLELDMHVNHAGLGAVRGNLALCVSRVYVGAQEMSLATEESAKRGS